MIFKNGKINEANDSKPATGNADADRPVVCGGYAASAMLGSKLVQAVGCSIVHAAKHTAPAEHYGMA